jgi:hypothetical protein
MLKGLMVAGLKLIAAPFSGTSDARRGQGSTLANSFAAKLVLENKSALMKRAKMYRMVSPLYRRKYTASLKTVPTRRLWPQLITGRF